MVLYGYGEKLYACETSRGMPKGKNRRDVRNGVDHNAFVAHALSANDPSNFDGARVMTRRGISNQINVTRHVQP